MFTTIKSAVLTAAIVIGLVGVSEARLPPTRTQDEGGDNNVTFVTDYVGPGVTRTMDGTKATVTVSSGGYWTQKPGGATYYISQSEGDNSNDGLTADTPFKTFADTLDGVAAIEAGTRVRFKRGDTWTGAEALVHVNSTGASDNWILLDDYGTGALPKFDGSELITDLDASAEWSQTGYNASIYELSPSGLVTTQPYLIMDTDTNEVCYKTPSKLYLGWAMGDLTGSGAFWYDSTNDTVHAWVDGYDDPDTRTMRICTTGIFERGLVTTTIDDADYIKFKNLEVIRSKSSGFKFAGDYNWLENCVASYAPAAGIQWYGYTSSFDGGDYGLAENCSVSYTNYTGSQAFTMEGTGHKLINCTASGNQMAGFDWLRDASSVPAFDTNDGYMTGCVGHGNGNRPEWYMKNVVPGNGNKVYDPNLLVDGANNITIEDCVFYGAGDHPLANDFHNGILLESEQTSGSDGNPIYQTNNIIIRNCLSFGNSGKAFSMGNSNFEEEFNGDITVTGCTFVRGPSPAYATLGFTLDTPDARIFFYNNVCHGGGSTILRFGTPDLIEKYYGDYNILYRNSSPSNALMAVDYDESGSDIGNGLSLEGWQQYTGEDANSLEQDPLFDSTGSDLVDEYFLGFGSPAYDLADTDYSSLSSYTNIGTTLTTSGTDSAAAYDSGYHYDVVPVAYTDSFVRSGSGSAALYYNTYNVGIGTVNPEAKLEVNGDVSITGTLTVNDRVSIDTTGAGWYPFLMKNNTLEVGFWTSDSVALFGTKSAHDLQFFTNNTPVNVEIDTAGNVGIGTSVPVTRLHAVALANDEAQIWEENSGGEYYKAEVNATGDLIFKNDADATVLTLEDANGNVGIGTAAPDGELEVVGTDVELIIDASQNLRLMLDKGGANRKGVVQYRTAGSTKWNAGTPDSDNAGDGDEYFIGSDEGGVGADIWIEPTGNIGMGTLAPTSKLHVVALADDSAIVIEENSGGEYQTISVNSSGSLVTTTDGGTVGLSVNDSSNASDDGKVGVGQETPVTEFHVTRDKTGMNTIRLDNTIATAVGDGNRIEFVDSNDIISYIESDNNLGDLTISSVGNIILAPAKELTVDGNIHATTILADGGTLTLGGSGGSNNENVTFDFESASNQVRVSSSSGAGTFYFRGINAKLNDDKPMTFGGNDRSKIQWETQDNDSLQIGTRLGNAAYTGYVSVMEYADIGVANRSPLAVAADPTLRIYSADAGVATDYIEMYHDQDDGVIATGVGDLVLSPAGNVGIGTATPAAKLDVTGDAFVSEHISVGTSSPSASFRGTGDIYATSGIKAMEGLYSEAVPYGAGLEVLDNSMATKYTNIITGTATLTAATQIISDPEGSFDDTYKDCFLKVISSTPSYTGATGQIESVPSSTTLVVSFGTAGSDTIVDASDMSFVIYEEPRAFIGDNGDMLFCVGESDDASFKICAEDSNNDHAVHIVNVAGVNGNAALDIDISPSGYSDISAIGIYHDMRGSTALTVGTGIDMIIDVEGAAGEYHALDVALGGNNSTANIAAIGTHTGIKVVHQEIGTPATLTRAMDNAAIDYDLTNSGTTETWFEADNDYMYIGSDLTFNEVNVILDSGGNVTINPLFQYYNGSWTNFSPADDTDGFQKSATIREIIATIGEPWVKVDIAGEGTTWYAIRLKRRRNIMSTYPVVREVTVTSTSEGEYRWDEDGDVNIKTIAVDDGITAPDTILGQAIIYVDTADGDLKVKFGDGTVKTLATD